MKSLIAVFVLCATTSLVAQVRIPNGTILPIELKSSLNSSSVKNGQVIAGRIAQDVPLPEGKIHAGSKVIGHVVSATTATDNNAEAALAFRFDTLIVSKRTIKMSTNLRALASPRAVWDAQLPLTGPDRGTSENSWNTVLVGQDEVSYRGGGPVAKGLKVVGEPTPGGGVLVNVSAPAGTRCRGEFETANRPQALWVFSSDACGLYDLHDLTLSHAGRSEPFGQILLASARGNVKLQSGSGMLLRVIGTTP